MKTITLEASEVKLMVDKLEIDEMAASASISLNPNVAWMKLLLTDDKFNANRQRVPREEFANVLRTGLFMPLKMAYGEISEGHAETFPLGVMTHLKTEGNSIQALAALWDRERHEDIEFLRKRYSEGKGIHISWELTYTDEENEDDGVVLKNVSMNAATIVGMPAYEGRTPALALSSKEEGDSMENTIELTEHDKLMNEQKQQYETKVSEIQASLDTVQTELTTLKPQYEDLVNFKKTIEEAEAKKQKLDSIRQKFVDASLEITDEYFNERAEAFAGMSDEQLGFFIQELVAAFKPSNEEGKASISITSKKVPAINTPNSGTITPADMVAYLKKNEN